jgi:phosphorylase kinase alpha/beta subunit
LLNLSPFEMKNLLHHILSGKEFAISSGKSHMFFHVTEFNYLHVQKRSAYKVLV